MRKINVFVILFVSLLSSIAAPLFLDKVATLGVHIPQPDIEADYVFAVLWATALWVSILAWPVTSRDKRGLLWIWGVKSFVTLGFMLFYEANYSVIDSYGYFANSTQSDFPFDVGIGAGTENIMALAWLHNQIFPDSYHALKVSFSMVGLIGVYIFYRAWVMFLGREDIRALYFTALLPSILFWSSILGKEPVILLGIAFYTYGVVGWYRLKRIRYLLITSLGIMVSILVRLWMGPILIVPLCILFLLQRTNLLLKVVLMASVLAAFFLLMAQFKQMFGIETVQDMLEITQKISRSFSEGGSSQEVGVEFTSIGNMLAFAPIGAFTALFRPLPGEVLNPLGLLAGFENLLLVILCILAMIRSSIRKIQEPLVVWGISIVVIWATVYGFVSCQNLGTAVRYRSQILPILLGLLLYFLRLKEVSLKKRT